MSARAVPRWPSPHRPLRQVVADLLAVAAALAVPLAVAAHWLDATVRSTDRYVATMAPLASNRVFTDALAVQVTGALYENLPAGVRSSPEAAVTRAAVERALAATMASPAFGPVWDAANREAHRQAVAVLSGSGDVRVAVALTGLVVAALGQVGAPEGFVAAARAAASGGRLSVVLLTAAQVEQARRVLAFLGVAQWWLTGAVPVLLGLALALASRRWSVLCWFAVAALGAVGLAWGALALAGHLVVARGADSPLGPAASGQVFATVVRQLRRDFLAAATAAGGLGLVTAVLAVRDGRHRRRRRYFVRPA